MASRVCLNDALVMALAAGQSIPQAAAAARVSERTVYRRLESAELRSRVTAARQTMLSEAAGKLASIGGKAADTLDELLQDDSPTVRLGAARCVLEQMTRLAELLDLHARVEALEQLQPAQPQPGHNGRALL